MLSTSTLLWGEGVQTMGKLGRLLRFRLYSSRTVSFLLGVFDYARREVMIPMRDRVKLHTVVLVPKGSKNAPILLTRTPYNADELTTHINSSHLGPNLYGYDNATNVILEGGYIRVIQDIRGKYGSEGDYVMNRPLSMAPRATM